MNANRNKLYGAAVICLFGIFSMANAGVQPASNAASKPTTQAAKPAAKTAKSTKSVKTAKTAKKIKSAKAQAKPVTVAAQAMPAAVAVANVPQGNPYLVNVPRNPYLATQYNNPYLAYQRTASYTPPRMNLAENPLLAMLGKTLMQSMQKGNAQQGGNGAPGSKLSLSPLPVEIFMQPNQRPTVAVNTPCMQIQRATNGFPPFTAAENFMFEMTGKINDSNALPFAIEPVCV